MQTWHALIKRLFRLDALSRLYLGSFALAGVELCMAYLPLHKINMLVKLAVDIGSLLPVFRVAETNALRAYMSATLLLLPVKVVVIYAIFDLEKRTGVFDFVVLPTPGHRFSFRMIISGVALVFFVCVISYLSFFEVNSKGLGIAFTHTTYCAFDAWWYWAAGRLTVLCLVVCASTLFVQACLKFLKGK